jgi:hypothetical protein
MWIQDILAKNKPILALSPMADPDVASLIGARINKLYVDTRFTQKW